MLYLASQSSRRRELLKQITECFEAISPDVEELESGKNPLQIVLYNAGIKAEAVYKNKKEGFVIGSDTIVVFGGKIFGKPNDAESAKAMLRLLSGKTHRVITGVCVIGGGRKLSKSCTTYVTFNVLSEDFINAYVLSGKALDKAGAYGIQDGGFAKSIRGSRLNVIGFPVKMVRNMLKEVGYCV